MDADGKQNSGNSGTDDLATAEIFGSDVRAKAGAGEPGWASLGLFRPSEDRFHQEGVNAAESEAPKNASREGAASLACDQHVGARGALGKREVSMLFDDQLAAQRHHEEHAKPAAEKRQRKNPPKSKFRAEAQKDQRRNREHDARGERFAGGARGLHDVVFENGGAAERAQDADGEHRDGDGRGDRKPSAQADVHGDRSEEQAEESAENHSAKSEFLERFVRGDVGAKFSRGRRGTPWTITH